MVQVTCPVALTPYAMGCVMIPWMFIMMFRWHLDGQKAAGAGFGGLTA